MTVTDHDSIGSVEELRNHPDFFLSEEVTCMMPSGTEIHMGVYGIQERHHLALQKRRGDVASLIAYLGEQNLFFTINHVYSSLTGKRTHTDFSLFEACFPGIETRNGQMLETCNRSAAELASRWNKTAIAGSDAHTLAALGRTFTEVPGATTTADFIDGLKSRSTRVHGVSGDYWSLTQAVIEIGLCLMREKAWTVVLAPLFLAVPFVTLGNLVREHAFNRKWSRRLECATPPVGASCAGEGVA